MMKFKSAAAVALLSITCAAALAQQPAAADAGKTELAAKLVALQQGAEMDQLSAQLTGNAVAPMLAKWSPRLQSEVPENRRKEVSDMLNAELNKFRDDTFTLIRSKAPAVSTETMVPAYAERFSEDELRQLIAFFEAPVVRKYQAALPEVLNALIQKLVETVRGDVQARTAAFDAAAAKIIGAESSKKGASKKK